MSKPYTDTDEVNCYIRCEHCGKRIRQDLFSQHNPQLCEINMKIDDLLERL